MNIYFSYKDKYIFKNSYIKIQPNTFNAVIGPSGSGKTTLFKLLLRFEKVQTGHIYISNHPIESYSLKQYSKLVTCVLQNPYLFHMSIYDNLALINPNIDQIKNACKQAEIDDFIMSLPHQYHTILENEGNHLSGGQLQRIAIARALLQNSKIILLDEITSALDEKTSLDIIHTLIKLSATHTIIMISHKPNEYQYCDHIIHMPIE